MQHRLEGHVVQTRDPASSVVPSKILSVIHCATPSVVSVPQRTAHRKRFQCDKNVEKKVDNARACGSQRRAAGAPQAARTVLCFSASPQEPAA